MNRAKALAIVKDQLTAKRYQHTIGVTDTAVKLAKKYGADWEKAEIAGIFHDYAKFRPEQEMIEIIKNREDIKEDLLHYGSQLWHAPVGAFLVEKEVGIHDEDILQAIRSHTTGRANMTQLEKIIFLADYIEPGRSQPGVEHVRELAEESLDLAVLQVLINTIQFLLEQRQPIYPDTMATYNHLTGEVI